MKLSIVTKEHAETIRKWRNENIDMLRTPFMLTPEMQEEFYINTICNRNARDRFWSVMHGEDDTCFIGMVGLINISLENRSAEISIVIDPDARGRGYGKQAVELLLREGFYRLNIDNIYGECYECNPALEFWNAFCLSKDVETFKIPNRKYLNETYYDSIYFNFTRGDM